jgi:hypothetical protein
MHARMHVYVVRKMSWLTETCMFVLIMMYAYMCISYIFTHVFSHTGTCVCMRRGSCFCAAIMQLCTQSVCLAQQRHILFSSHMPDQRRMYMCVRVCERDITFLVLCHSSICFCSESLLASSALFLGARSETICSTMSQLSFLKRCDFIDPI